MRDPYDTTALTPARPAWTNPETLDAVRPAVRAMLEAAPGFAGLPPAEQRSLANAMVKVSSYMANPDGLAAEELSPEGGVLAAAQADPAQGAAKKANADKGFAGEDFVAGGVREGVEQFGEMVRKVDFPAFVSGLIQNVFQAIVDSSIEQMRAYGELLANVAKTVDQFAQDNITENNARDWLADRYAGELEIQTESAGFGFADDGFGDDDAKPQPKLAPAAGVDDPNALLKRIAEELQMAKVPTDLSDPAQERLLVQAARLQIARSRQQLLSSMVILGINRIVVTDGQIHAKVVFGMRGSDIATRRSRASVYDQKESASRAGVRARYGGWFSPVKASAYADTSQKHMTTVGSSLDETSESQAEVKAKLSGEVRVNFKSDFLPMEKMATPEMIAAIQGNAQPLEKPVEGA